jgi:hypothetical protein
MADTAHKDPVEIEETDPELETKAEKFAQMVKKSKHFTIFTGAGISTSAGLKLLARNYLLTINYYV